MWWSDLLYGIWNGLTAWFVLVVHVFGGWAGFPVYDVTRGGNWYDFGFLLGAGSPFLAARFNPSSPAADGAARHR